MWNLVSGNLRSHVGVAEKGTVIRNGLETYQQEFVGVMGCNNWLCLVGESVALCSAV